MAAGTEPEIPTLVRELAEAHGVRDCLQWFTREKQRINEQHVQLCRIPAPTFLEQKRAEWMAQQFSALGCQAEIDRAGNLLARLGPDDGSPLIALTAHLDTVLAPRTRDEIVVDPDGTFRGPGVSDNGAGLAALLAIARAMRSSPPLQGAGAALLLVANVGEEGEGNLSGMRYLARQSPLAPRIKSYLVLDGPALDHITSRALASRRFEVVFTGPGGHSWNDYGNPNPVHALSHTIAWFTDQCSGMATDGVAPRAILQFRHPRGRLQRQLDSCDGARQVGPALRRQPGVRRAGRHAGPGSRAGAGARESACQRRQAGRKNQGDRLAAGRPASGRRIHTALSAGRRHVPRHPRAAALASTDANIPLSLGIPSLSIGAGGQGGGNHTPAEWYHPEGRDLGLKRILLTLAMLMKENG